jgi:hypothetical protein
MEAADLERHRNVLFNINKAKAAVLGEPCRLVTRSHIMQLNGCKDMLCNVSTTQQQQQQQHIRNAAAIADLSDVFIS